ncbi:hypothetical protein BN1708_007968, partial [Verticillium longisporum]
MAPSLEAPLEAPEAVEDVIANPQKPSLVAPEPEHCPGPESEQAGTADSCAGCPNQAICASAPKGPDPDIPIISARLSGIKHKILVLSGKGGSLVAEVEEGVQGKRVALEGEDDVVGGKKPLE